jgi:hypothetical protein
VEFSRYTRFEVGYGSMISFWQDVWYGIRPLEWLSSLDRLL